MQNLFSSIDDHAGYFLRTEEFEESLLFNVLFQDRLLIPDFGFFNCTHLGKHVISASDRGQISLFEAAAREGIVSPIFRDRSHQVLEQFRESAYSSALYGTDYKLVPEHLKSAVLSILAAMKKGGSKITPRYYPDRSVYSLGDAFENLAKYYLLSEDLPKVLRRDDAEKKWLRKLWGDTIRLRMELLPAAISSTKSRGQPGLQRAEIFRHLGAKYGFNGNEVPLLGDLFARVRDPEEKVAMEAFCQWITQIYQLNQARSLACAFNFPAYSHAKDFIADSILAPSGDMMVAPSGVVCVNVNVSLPRVDLLLKSKAAEIVAIRSELGGAYLYALSQWELHKTQDSANQVEVQLVRYCDAIRARFLGAETTNVLVEHKIRAGDGVDLLMNVATLTEAILSQSPLSFVRSSVAIIGKLSTLTLKILGRRARRQSQKLQQTPIDLMLPA